MNVLERLGIDYAALVNQEVDDLPEWVQYFIATEDGLRESCPDCAVKIGVMHEEGCDWARCQVCGYQRLSCSCKGGGGDIWIGICAPESHKICYENNFWCRDLVEKDGDTRLVVHPTDVMDHLHGKLDGRILFHQPCERDAEGAHADLNRAALFMSQQGMGNGCISPDCLGSEE